MGDFSEGVMVEKPTIALFRDLGYTVKDCFHETYGPKGTLGRETPSEVVLVSKLRPALKKLNPTLPSPAIEEAIQELTRDRRSMSMARANQEIYKLIKDGVRVTVRENGQEQDELVRVIDWTDPKNNDCFLASQLWISGEMHSRRADLVGFVNGLPLVFIELKASHKRLEDAYNRNLRDYKDTIPHAFWYNAFIILSNGSKSRIGTITAGFEHFSEWKKINSEGETGIVSLDTIIRGTCEQSRLLDIVENFILFVEARGALLKVVAKNHQFLGVNNSIKALGDLKKNKGRLGVFWHTQGSGKSYSMIFFCQKVLRKLPGNWTFVIVTDREALDTQIYENFADAGVVTEQRVQAQSGHDLQRLLTEDHRYVFTLIQKFRAEKGKPYPKLSDRSDVIVITDEAHRTQYDVLALNMRTALPKAAFIGFTATPLIAAEEKTREVFGDYVSVYNFKQSVDDGNTVPLFYENRIPELQLTNKDLKGELQDLLESADLDEEQEKKLEREFSREYHLITRDDRLEKVAEDVVSHFVSRGFLGKGMVLSIDRFTAVKMYDKVKKHWAASLAKLRESAKKATGAEKEDLAAKIRFMEETAMAVVISQSQNEIADFKAKGLDIAPHRRRIVGEGLDEEFKDPKNKLRLVFVCAMWTTGFDALGVSTIYLDKPMRNHTLMQAIARANRVFEDKTNGLIVDYVGVFREMKKALAIYGSASGGGVKAGDWPVQPKDELVALLRGAVKETLAFCTEKKIDVGKIRSASGFRKIKLLDDAVDAILSNEESKSKFLALASRVEILFKAVLPDEAANEFLEPRALLDVLVQKIKSLGPEVDISGVMEKVEVLLDKSVAAEPYAIQGKPKLLDLSKVDFEALRKNFAKGHKHIEAERLKIQLEIHLSRLVRLNRTRADLAEKFQKLLDEYNSGALNVDTFYNELVAFTRALSEDEKLTIAEGLSEEERAIFDLLTRPSLELTKKEEAEVKRVAKELLSTLKPAKIVIDWRKKQQARAGVRLTIARVLEKLPSPFTPLYEQKCDLVYHHVYDSYFGPGKSVYSES